MLGVRESSDGREAAFFKWGLVPSCAKDPAIGSKLIGASLLGGPLNLQQLGNGQGHSDYVFTLDAAAAARLQAVINAHPGLLLGLSASVSNAQGGPESFFIGSAPAAVPEPATMLLLGTGLVGVAAKVRRRKKS